MRLGKTSRGFEVLDHPQYTDEADTAIVSASSVVGNYPDAIDRPGTSALWIGPRHHLSREDVKLFIAHLQAWLDTGSLALPELATVSAPPAGFRSGVVCFANGGRYWFPCTADKIGLAQNRISKLGIDTAEGFQWRFVPDIDADPNPQPRPYSGSPEPAPTAPALDA